MIACKTNLLRIPDSYPTQFSSQIFIPPMICIQTMKMFTSINIFCVARSSIDVNQCFPTVFKIFFHICSSLNTLCYKFQTHFCYRFTIINSNNFSFDFELNARRKRYPDQNKLALILSAIEKILSEIITKLISFLQHCLIISSFFIFSLFNFHLFASLLYF